MQISYPNDVRTDIFAPAARNLLASANHLASPVTRMGIALQSRQAHIFAGIDLDLEPAHRQERKDARRAAGKRQRQARRIHRSRK